MITFPMVLIYLVLASTMSKVLPPVDYQKIGSTTQLEQLAATPVTTRIVQTDVLEIK